MITISKILNMSITTTCFLKLSPQSSIKPSSATASPKPKQFPARQSERSVTSRFVAGIACVVIGLDVTISMQHAESLALAATDPKWSDKRMCPAWQMNSLETIVPENLPRPSAKRRWEIVGFDSSGADPATVRIRVFRNGNGCFSM
ncbi:hypothetical protein QQ045_031363 [Rhodiola kirilowii]